jgi:hypothetical protein
MAGNRQGHPARRVQEVTTRPDAIYTHVTGIQTGSTEVGPSMKWLLDNGVLDGKASSLVSSRLERRTPRLLLVSLGGGHA